MSRPDPKFQVSPKFLADFVNVQFGSGLVFAKRSVESQAVFDGYRFVITGVY